MKEENSKPFFKKEEDYKIFQEVFDNKCFNLIHELAGKGWFNSLEHIVSTGKEAHVYKAVDANNNPRAVKIYKIETSAFKHMSQYIEGDRRFKNIKKGKRNIVYTWTKKEYKNLKKCVGAKITSPIPLIFKNNILVMGFIGKDDAAPLLKDVIITDKQEKLDLYNKIIENIARLLYIEELIHADLSEYNILYYDKIPYFIDVGQGVLTTHPKAKEFFERDITNMAKYFKKIGLEKTSNNLKEDIKALKSGLIKK